MSEKKTVIEERELVPVAAEQAECVLDHEHGGSMAVYGVTPAEYDRPQ